MKTILAGVVAALALSSLTIAHADDLSVKINKTATPQRYHLQEADFHDFKNTYLLEDGQKVTFSARMNQYYTQLGDGDRERIYAVSPTAFVTERGARIEFREKGDTVGISNFEKLSTAGNLPANTVVMARR
ncbi:gel scht [Duganella sp. FT135W]|uniref:Gel scht n=1 Tax=Duganella flavida TaxID=2692175 RepID=A0A6L8KIH2_9BURK|nr:gel scht [Duganella flavida]MYM25614.1 gel scht [Duganella flavida]